MQRVEAVAGVAGERKAHLRIEKVRGSKPLSSTENQGLNCGDVDRARFLHATRTTGVPPCSVRNGE